MSRQPKFILYKVSPTYYDTQIYAAIGYNEKIGMRQKNTNSNSFSLHRIVALN